MLPLPSHYLPPENRLERRTPGVGRALLLVRQDAEDVDGVEDVLQTPAQLAPYPAAGAVMACNWKPCFVTCLGTLSQCRYRNIKNM